MAFQAAQPPNEPITSSSLHLIPDDEDEAALYDGRRISIKRPHETAAGDYEDALEAFHQVRRLSSEIVSTVIIKQAAAVNSRLLSVQTRQMNEENKRMRITPDPTLSTTEVYGGVSDEEKISIWRQATRMKRISTMLRSIEMTQRILAKELEECAAEREL
jgi:hypothetical protein